MRWWLRYYAAKPRLWWVEWKRRHGRLSPCDPCAARRCDACTAFSKPWRGCSCFDESCDAAQAEEEAAEREESNGSES